MVSKSGCEPAFAGSCCAGDYHGDAATDVFAGAELRYVRSVKSAYGVVCQFVDLHLIAEPGVFEQACVAVGAAHVVLSMKENGNHIKPNAARIANLQEPRRNAKSRFGKRSKRSCKNSFTFQLRSGKPHARTMNDKLLLLLQERIDFINVISDEVK